jgi:hypothetical protein
VDGRRRNFADSRLFRKRLQALLAATFSILPNAEKRLHALEALVSFGDSLSTDDIP